MRILIVEDQAIFREILRNLCARDLGQEVLGEASDGEKALELSRALAPDLVLLDLELPVRDGFSVIAALRTHKPSPRILVLSSHCDDFTVLRIEQYGVDGFVDKNTSTAAGLGEAFAAIERGGRYFSPTFQRVRAARRRDSGSFDKLLSEREQGVLALIGELRDDAEIGRILGIRERTVETHRFNIMRKLGLDSRLSLERFARDHGFTRSAVKGRPGSGLR